MSLSLFISSKVAQFAAKESLPFYTLSNTASSDGSDSSFTVVKLTAIHAPGCACFKAAFQNVLRVEGYHKISSKGEKKKNQTVLLQIILQIYETTLHRTPLHTKRLFWKILALGLIYNFLFNKNILKLKQPKANNLHKHWAKHRTLLLVSVNLYVERPTAVNKTNTVRYQCWADTSLHL